MKTFSLLCLTILGLSAPACFAASARNVILFVPDGLRSGIVTPETAPALAELRASGVDFTNSHSMMPTFTMPNASALATGHYLGDTGVFGNTMLMPPPLGSAPGAPSRTPFIENNTVLNELNDDPRYHGRFIRPETLLAAARKAGFAVAAIGKSGPAGLHDMALIRPGAQSAEALVFDDTSGNKGGLEISDQIKDEIVAKTGHAPMAPRRGDNGRGGTCERAGTLIANEAQQGWLTDIATKVVLPRFQASGKPFFIVFWARDPDGTQHNQGDSYGQLVPGINGPTSMKAIANTDGSLRQIRSALVALGLDQSTDILVSADHGFSTVAKESQTSSAPRIPCAGHEGLLPSGFLAKDVAKLLALPAADPVNGNRPITPGGPPQFGHTTLGSDPTKPEVAVIANGGSDLIYVPGSDRKVVTKRIVDFLLTQDYVSGLFVDDALGKIPGTLPMSAIGLKGAALTLQPAILVNFRSFVTDCGLGTLLCAATISDGGNIPGEGMHGSLSRADTANFMAAIGPSFKAGFKNLAPTSNADVGATIAHLLGLKINSNGALVGRVMTESLVGGKAVKFEKGTLKSAPGRYGLSTVLNYQNVGRTRYFDAAGFPGRTVGLEAALNP